jgi:hypothetical protein
VGNGAGLGAGELTSTYTATHVIVSLLFNATPALGIAIGTGVSPVIS